jgi:multiple sugar transport system ATP-binding protein
MADVTFESVSKIYDDGTRAVRGLDLAIGDGEFMVLVGPSGCGKTTALRMVAGLEEISEGAVRIGERVVNDVPPRDRDIAGQVSRVNPWRSGPAARSASCRRSRATR